MAVPPDEETIVPVASIGPVVAPVVCTELGLLGVIEHWELRSDPVCHWVLATRTPAAFAQIADIDASFRDIERILEAIPRSVYGLLVDARKGPSRNDDAFEMAMRNSRGRLLAGFDKRVSLVLTAVGRLQVQRFARDDGLVMLVTDDAAAALSYLGIGAHEL